MQLLGLTVASIWVRESEYQHRLWSHMAVDGRTGVLCCLLKFNLNFYSFVSQQDWPRSENCTYKQRSSHGGTKKDTLGTGTGHRKICVGMQSHTHSKTQIPMHRHNTCLAVQPDKFKAFSLTVNDSWHKNALSYICEHLMATSTLKVAIVI